MSIGFDLRPSVVSVSLQTLDPSPSGLIPGFACLAQRARNPGELITGAACVLGAALPFTHVLIVDCVGKPPAAQSAAGYGWGGVSAHHLAHALLTLPWITDWNDTGAPDHADYEITEIEGAARAELNTAVAFARPSGPFATAMSIQCPLRGHVITALLATPDATPDLTAEERCIASAVFTILGATLGIMLRKREYARRLKQVRRAKIAWEGTVDALPQVICVLDQEGMVTRANRGIETWGLGSVTTAAFGTLHELLHPGCADSRCGLASRLTTALSRNAANRSQQFEHADPLLGRDLRVHIGQVRSQSGQ